MKQVFADTSYWLALTSPKDTFHLKAVELSKTLQEVSILTTDLILGEFLNHFSQRGKFYRLQAIDIVREIKSEPTAQVIYCDNAYFDMALELYEARPDKNYSFTDCFSMLILKKNNLSEVLSADRHFEQEGFTRLLR